MKDLIKQIIGKDIHGFSIYDADFDPKKQQFKFICEPFEKSVIYDMYDYFRKNPIQKKEYLERGEDGLPVMHEIVFDAPYGISYTIDGKKDDMSYENFKDELCFYSYNPQLNNVFGIKDKEEVKDLIFKNILTFLLDSDEMRIRKYGNSITGASMTALLLGALKDIKANIDQDELNLDLAIVLEQMMRRYLIENPEYAEKIENINVRLNDLIRNTSYDKNPGSQPNHE